ncbi:MAG: hypothetical protein AAF196_18695 [Planctomycetota bacterium]
MRVAALFLLLVPLIGCDQGPSDFAQTEFRAMIGPSDPTLQQTDLSMSVVGTLSHHHWEVEIVAKEPRALEVFEAHKQRVKDALDREGLEVVSTGRSAGSLPSFHFYYEAPSGPAVIHCLLIKRPKDTWSIVQMVHEPSEF